MWTLKREYYYFFFFFSLLHKCHSRCLNGLGESLLLFKTNTNTQSTPVEMIPGNEITGKTVGRRIFLQPLKMTYFWAIYSPDPSLPPSRFSPSSLPVSFTVAIHAMEQSQCQMILCKFRSRVNTCTTQGQCHAQQNLTTINEQLQK